MERNIKTMLGYLVGSVWSVLGLEDATVVILAGPFAADRGTPEYLVAPLYSGRENGFIWTSEDVRLEPPETGLNEQRFAAIWNARPLLEADLGLQVGTLTEDATIAVRDAYWASLNERPLGASPRLGRPIDSAKDPAARFQAGELERWEPLSGRAFAPAFELSACTQFSIGDVWTLTPDELEVLSNEIEATEGNIGPTQLEAVGQNKALLTATVSFWPGSRQQADLFNSVHKYVVYAGSFTTYGVSLSPKERENLEEVQVSPELPRAA